MIKDDFYGLMKQKTAAVHTKLILTGPSHRDSSWMNVNKWARNCLTSLTKHSHDHICFMTSPEMSVSLFTSQKAEV